MSNLIGHSLGRYHILEQLGEGGMATVYKAYDTRLERDVAVKIIRTDLFGSSVLERMLKRFEREAKALAKLSHLHIIKVIDYGEHAGSPYLVMEYMPGGTLKQRLGKPIPWQETLRILLPVTEALEYAHAHNIIHRDIKPANILLTEKGQPMLTDFGIAKILESDETATLTGTGIGIGTPEYMAPEQWTGQSTTQSDIYSLGIVFYEMVTGRKPYTADTPAAILLKQANEPLPRPGKFAALPQTVENVLLKALAKNPKDRYQNMADLAQALEGLTSLRKTPNNSFVPSSSRKAPSGNKRVGFKFFLITRRMLITAGVSALGIVLIAIFAFLFKSIPAVLIPTSAASNTLPPEIILTPANTAASIISAIPDSTNTPPSTPTPTPVEIKDKQGVQMVFVPAGDAIVGVDPVEECKNSAYKDSCEKNLQENNPLRTVFVDGFYIDKYEVSNSSYRECAKARKCNGPSDTKLASVDYYNNSTYDNYPVVWVYIDMAKQYCDWRGARLPTGVEWEKAARSTDGRTYPWGNSLGETPLANFCDKGASCWSNPTWDINDGYALTSPVDSFPLGVSPYGVYNLAGNVSEWVSDSIIGDNSWITGFSLGGSWFDSDQALKVYLRTSGYNFYGMVNGLRCARSTSP